MSKKDRIKAALSRNPSLTALQIAAVLEVRYSAVAKTLTDMTKSSDLVRFRDENKGPGFFNQYKYILAA